MKTPLQRNDRTNTGPLLEAVGAGCSHRCGPEQAGPLASGAEESGDVWMALRGISLDLAGLMSCASVLANDSAFLHFCTVLLGTLEPKPRSDTALG